MSDAYAFGIDIGGTKIAIALVSCHGAIVARSVFPTEAELGFERAVSNMIKSIRQIRTAYPSVNILGIGVGCAGPVDSGRGLINNPYTLAGWNQCDIVSPLTAELELPVLLENDADVAALAEARFGAGRGHDPIVMLTFGTGVGGGAIVHGHIYRGVNGEHPELGHIATGIGGLPCYCGTSGCLESIASGTALGEAGVAAGFSDTRHLFAQALADNETARDIVARGVEAAASAAWTICHTFLPQRLILGGGIMESQFELFAATIRMRLSSATQFSSSLVTIAQAALGNDAGMVGAACLKLFQ